MKQKKSVEDYLKIIYTLSKRKAVHGADIAVELGVSRPTVSVALRALAEDNRLSVKSLASLKELLQKRNLHPMVITGHTGWSDDMDFVFAHTDLVCNASRKQKLHDPNAPDDGYDESDDTREKAKTVRPEKALPVKC